MAARRVKRYVLAIGFVFFVFRVSLTCIFRDDYAIQHLDWWIQEKPFYWLWLMLVGHHLAIYFKDPDFLARWRGKLLWTALSAYAVGGLILFWLTMKEGRLPDGGVSQRFFEREFALYLAAQMGMFVFFVSLDPGRGLLAKAALFVADKTFYVYLIHESVYHKLLGVAAFNLELTGHYLGLAGATFLISLAVAIGLKKAERLIASKVAKAGRKGLALARLGPAS
jgi:hypothetical protein